ncbi:FtsX-like permease family protein [Streptomyces sp. NBC_00457]|uniref:ABC transporter permease n=1 Tax=Streptomyces sp. NBC_00457 TaxID=2975748 RepID=UPI002E24BA0D
MSGALGRVVRAGVGRRRVQTAVIVLTTLLSVAASVLAVGLLVASQAPFDRAFARQHGAHLTAEFASVAPGKLAQTASADGVKAAAGPFAVTSVRLSPAHGGPPGITPPPLTVAGRASADAAVDDLGLVTGRWAKEPGEIVLEAGSGNPGMGPGSTVYAGDVELTVVGIAESVGESADAWVVPAQLTALDAQPSYQMLYRFTDADSRADIAAGRDAIAAAVPARTLTGTQSYLDVKQAAEATTAAYIPFVTAFALLGLAMSVLVIGIVVSGAVSAATRRIGILKSLGLTPLQVGRAYVAQALIPAAVGAALGVALGGLLAVPLMAELAAAYGTGMLLIPLWVNLVVPAGVLAVVALTAFGPALRAARLRTASVLGVGRAATAARGRGVRQLLGRLPLPRPVTLGLAGPFARPARSGTMAAAVAFGALAVTFAVGLGSTLFAIQRDGEPDLAAGEVTVRTMSPPQPGAAPGGPVDPDVVAAAIKSRPETASSYRTARSEVRVAGLKGGVPVVAYDGDAAHSRHSMVSGRWFDTSGEAVAGSRFLTVTGVKVGDTVTLSEQGRTVRLRIVGEVFDLSEEGMTVRTSFSALAPLDIDYLPSDFSVRLKSGADARSYVDSLNADLEATGGEAALTEQGESTVIRAMRALIAMLTAMLVTVACLGVLNTVVLDTRDRTRDLGIFKALGMTPRQTVAQVLTAVAGIGLAAGAIGVPLGVALHGYVMPEMGRAVGVRFPSELIDVYDVPDLTLLALSGVLIAVAGALLPAGWAARTRVAGALRAE